MSNLLAQDPIKNPVGPSQGKSGIAFFQDLIPALVGMGLLVGVLIFLAVMISGAIQWIASGGDKAALESARGKIFSALTGIILLFAVFAIMKILETFFPGLNVLTLDIGPLKIE